jgi:hypothetical protein
MQNDGFHISDQDLLLAADGELPPRSLAKVQAHLVACWTCRARMREIDRTIAEFVRVREELTPPLPPAGTARAQLRLNIAAIADSVRPRLWRRVWELASAAPLLAVGACGALALLLGSLLPSHAPNEDSRTTAFPPQVRSIPDPQLTPGATLPVTMRDVCTDRAVDTERSVPSFLALQVFAAYGIHQPQSGAYEIDYLITPALGGSDDIRNFWPQPYGTTIWNAHIKDALEDRLHGLVCAGQLDLTKAQQDISRDWVSAYKKYFHTSQPLAEHASFLKDRPWG